MRFVCLFSILLTSTSKIDFVTLDQRAQQNKAVQTTGPTDNTPSFSQYPIKLGEDNHRASSVATQIQSKPRQTELLPKFHRPHTVSQGTVSLRYPVSAKRVTRAHNPASNGEQLLTVVAKASRLESRKSINQTEEIDVVELNNQPATQLVTFYYTG